MNAPAGSTLAARWCVPANAAQVIVADGHAYITMPTDSGDWAPGAVDLATGRVLWRSDLIDATPVAVAGDALYVRSNPGVTALNAVTGAVEWRSTDTDMFEYGGDDVLSGTDLVGSSEVARGTVQIRVWDSRTGERRWALQLDGSAENRDLVAADGVVATAVKTTRSGQADRSFVVGVDLAAGKEMWRVDVGDEVSQLLATNGLVLVRVQHPGIERPDDVIALDQHTGERRWSQPIDAAHDNCSSVGSPLVATTGLLIGSSEGGKTCRGTFALDLTTGTEKWKTDPIGMPFVAGNRIVGLHTYRNPTQLVSIDLTTGGDRHDGPTLPEPIIFDSDGTIAAGLILRFDGDAITAYS